MTERSLKKDWEEHYYKEWEEHYYKEWEEHYYKEWEENYHKVWEEHYYKEWEENYHKNGKNITDATHNTRKFHLLDPIFETLLLVQKGVQVHVAVLAWDKC
jgi:hypothetical protein